MSEIVVIIIFIIGKCLNFKYNSYLYKTFLLFGLFIVGVLALAFSLLVWFVVHVKGINFYQLQFIIFINTFH